MYLSLSLLLLLYCVNCESTKHISNHEAKVKTASAAVPNELPSSLVSLILETDDEISAVNIVDTFSGKAINSSITSYNGKLVASLVLDKERTAFLTLLLTKNDNSVESRSLQITPKFELETLQVLKGNTLQVLSDDSETVNIEEGFSKRVPFAGNFWGKEKLMRGARIKFKPQNPGKFIANHQVWQKKETGEVACDKTINLSTNSSIELLVEIEKEEIDFLVERKQN